MKLRNLLILTLVVVTATLTIAQGKSGKPTYPAYNVTTTISNADASGSFAIQSDNNGPYTNGGFVGGVTGEYSIDLSGQTVRSVYIDFQSLTANAGSPPMPLPSGYYYPTIFSRCYDSSGNLVQLLSIAAGTSNNNCSMRLNFTTGGQSYSFAMAPSVNLPAGAPVTGSASVACNHWASDGSGCDSWTITPYVLGANGTSADLIQIGKAGRNTVIGSYSGDTFRIDLQR